jgi:hypothetical protein
MHDAIVRHVVEGAVKFHRHWSLQRPQIGGILNVCSGAGKLSAQCLKVSRMPRMPLPETGHSVDPAWGWSSTTVIDPLETTINVRFGACYSKHR